MSKEYTVTVRLTANEAEAIRNALRFATRPSLAGEWEHSHKERRYAESGHAKVAEVMDRWERRG